MILELAYGTMPGPPEDTQIEILDIIKERDKVIWKKMNFKFIPKNESESENNFNMVVTIRFPTEAIIEKVRNIIPNFDEKGLPCIIYVGDNPCSELYEQGYIVINYKNDQLEPMYMGKPTVGPARKTYDTLFPGEYSWGSIAVWAWGGMRMVDYANSLSDVNNNRIIITGHSRNGKAALLAGALDDRISIINPAGSGCAGAGSYLVLDEGCEDIASLTDTRRWCAWMCADFAHYGYKEENMIFDQHFVMGLVAPRPLLLTEGILDEWANPKGTAAMFIATEEIYKFLGEPKNIQLALRPGGHTHNHEDMKALLSFANACFFGIPQERIFKDLVCKEKYLAPFKDWKCPFNGS